jgi:hypothetical protein
LWGSWACCLLFNKLKFIKNGIHMHLLLFFFCDWTFLPVHWLERFLLGFYLPLSFQQNWFYINWSSGTLWKFSSFEKTTVWGIYTKPAMQGSPPKSVSSHQNSLVCAERLGRVRFRRPANSFRLAARDMTCQFGTGSAVCAGWKLARVRVCWLACQTFLVGGQTSVCLPPGWIAGILKMANFLPWIINSPSSSFRR